MECIRNLIKNISCYLDKQRNPNFIQNTFDPNVFIPSTVFQCPNGLLKIFNYLVEDEFIYTRSLLDLIKFLCFPILKYNKYNTTDSLIICTNLTKKIVNKYKRYSFKSRDDIPPLVDFESYEMRDNWISKHSRQYIMMINNILKSNINHQIYLEHYVHNIIEYVKTFDIKNKSSISYYVPYFKINCKESVQLIIRLFGRMDKLSEYANIRNNNSEVYLSTYIIITLLIFGETGLITLYPKNKTEQKKTISLNIEQMEKLKSSKNQFDISIYFKGMSRIINLSFM
jgi:hypothetical protein